MRRAVEPHHAYQVVPIRGLVERDPSAHAEADREDARGTASGLRTDVGDRAGDVHDHDVGALVAHVAFWDLRVVVCIEAWKPDGTGPVPTYYDDAVDWINDSVKPLISALEPRVAARVTVEAAEAADRAVAGLSDELYARNESLGGLINPDRADHRLEHLEEIEQVLSRD